VRGWRRGCEVKRGESRNMQKRVDGDWEHGMPSFRVDIRMLTWHVVGVSLSRSGC
jgi:hypothetical protein